MAIVTGDRYLEKLVKFVEAQAGMLIEGTLVLKLNPAGLHYVQSRLESLHELERLLAWAPVDYLRAYVSDLGDHRALEQLRRILRLLTSLKVVSVLPPPSRDPTPLSLLPFGRLRFLELRGCDLSTSAARGLLELRHTLERLICHNSTDALRHVFASRIAEIKDSPQWNRLSFVSCACNDLLLMDESLQLLPAVETLDLSRNKFSKLDNLRKCLKLKHLDLGFNNLRTISSFTEVTPQIVKLVLRNNAITSLHGIENLKSLEGLDVSYNAISNFSELETLAGLPSLLSLWLEGNPISCARRYRAHVFSLFTYPEKLKLDDKGISTREYWKRQIIIASRQKRPASYGFYSPAKDGGGEEGNINLKKKKRSRLASIETEEESTCVCSDRDSLSCDYEASSKEEVGCDDEAEIVDLMKRAEFMKKERSTLWLREFKEWMDQSSVNSTVNGILNHKPEKYTESKSSHWHFGERSRFVSDSFPISQENINTNVLEADNIFSDMFSLSGDHQVCDQTAAEGGAGVVSQPVQGTDNTQEHSKVHLDDNHWSKHSKGLHFNTLISKEQHLAVNSSLSASAVDDKKEDHSSSSYPGSPPHYQANILHRRKDLVEEILHLSADSNSVTSSDSSTSSEDDFILDANETLNGGSEKWDGDEHMLISSFHEKCDDFRSLFARVGEIGQQLMGHSEKQPSTALDVSMQVPNNYSDFHNPVSVNRGAEQAEKRKGKRKPVKRVVALSAETSLVDQSGLLANSSDPEDSYCLEDAHNKQILGGRDLEEVSQRQSQTRVRTPVTDAASGRAKSSGGSDEFIENYFNMNVTASRTHETCTQYLRCDCVLEQESIYREREVALLQSSEHRLYVLLIGVRLDGSGIILSMLGCHMVEEIREVSVGMAFQVVRVCIDSGARYLFITRGVEKSRQLLETLEVMDSFATKLSWKSLEQVQVELFRKQICGAAKMNIFQYSMILFWHNKIKDKSWASRSLFVTRGQLLICMEDIRQFGALSKGSSSTPYFSLVSSCNVGDVSEMVVDEGSGHCVTLVLEHATLQFCPSIKVNNDITATPNENLSSGTLTWKIKWSSEKGLFQFVTLLKALHAATGSPLFIRHVS